MPVRRAAFTVTLLCVTAAGRAQQLAETPALRAGVMPDRLVLDGVLSEPGWSEAESVDLVAQTEPTDGAPPTARTAVRVLAGTKGLAIGIVCDDPEPERIVSFSVRRDAVLNNEDHVRVVLGPFRDGRSGYVFAVNPSGARYDGLIAPNGDYDNSDWDGIWEAATARTTSGWSVELRIPIQTLGFKSGLHEWHFNVQRRIQRLLETDRWASARRQYLVTQTSRAGLLTGLPEFDTGVGLSIRPAVTGGGGVPAPSASVDGQIQPSLDVTQRIGSNLLTSLTVNTDFAETEVDTRRTNLTRFPLFFPEKRTFFLEGSDILSFGLGLWQEVMPFFSRRIGLVGDSQVPIVAGGKINGRVGATSVAGLFIGTDDKAGVVPTGARMAVARVKQNIWKESTVGAIVTQGDPLGRTGSWLAGGDLTYATSTFRGSRNFLVGTWGLATGRDDLGSDSTAHGFMVSYPNDQWDINFAYRRVGRDFDPSVGFVPRRAIHRFSAKVDNRTRFATGPLWQMFHQFEPFVITDLSGHWESYEIFTAPINWRLRNGDRYELNVNPIGERLVVPFEVSPGVVIAPGSYRWMHYRLEANTAQKRRLYAQVTWWFGGFYDGKLDQFLWTGAWNPTPLLTVEFSGEHNVARLPAGDFTQTVVGNRLRVNLSSDLSLATYVQYDTSSHSIGTNTRLRWTFRPVADLFVVYNHNVRSILDRWQLDTNQLLVKIQYAFRY